MHQVIGTVRKQRALTRSNTFQKNDSNASLGDRVNCNRQSAESMELSRACSQPLKDASISQPHSNSLFSSPVDPSRISALLEIRRSVTLDSSQTNSARLRRKTKQYFRSAANKVRRVSSSITTMVSSDDEQCLPSLAVFHPYSGPRMVWDILIISLILYTAISLPLRLSWSLSETPTIWILDRLLDLLFMIDIAINLNTAFERGTELIVDRRQIIKHYLATWFALDFVASFPFDFFISLASNDSDSSLSMLPRLVRLFKLSRLFRLARLQRILRRVQLQLGIRNSTNKILKFSGAAILCAHWMACMFYATSTLTGDGAMGGEKGGSFPSWVQRLADDQNGEQLDADNIAHTYVASLYWSLTTMTSIGYGDVAPKTPSERLFGIFGMILGAVLFGHFMGNVLAVVADMSPAENEFHLKMDMLNVYMREQNLDTELRRQIEEFYHIEHKLTNHQVDEAEMLRELPGRLKRELSLAISRRILGNVPLFEGMSASFVRTVGLAMERKVYPQGETVIGEGEVVSHFYIVTAGRATLERAGIAIGALRNGDYFGSIPISLDRYSMDSARSTYSVRTAEWTEVRSLSISRFRNLIGQFDDAKHILIQRIVDNILEQNELDLSQSQNNNKAHNAHHKHEIVTLSSNVDSVVDSNANANSGLDRTELAKFVENALSLHSPKKSKKAPKATPTNSNSKKQSSSSSARRRSLISELRPEFGSASLLKDLRLCELQRTAAATSQQTMRRKLRHEMAPFDSLMAFLSLMSEHGNGSRTGDDSEMAQCLQYIAEHGLLTRMAQLRKLIHYFIVDKEQHIDDDADGDDAKESTESRIGGRMDAFFRPFVFVRSAEATKATVTQMQSAGARDRRRDSKCVGVAANVNSKQSERVLYHGVAVECREAMELMLFRLGYAATFSTSRTKSVLDALAAKEMFDVVMVDDDSVTQIERTLSMLSIASEQTDDVDATRLLCIVSNCARHRKLLTVAAKYGVHAILRRPLLFQDMREMLKLIGLAM